MFWGYLVLFFLAILTPEIIRSDLFFMDEEAEEAFMLFVIGCIAFGMYVYKDRKMLRYIREKLSLEREKNDMTRDLSDSYSYIGEANRKIDVLLDLVNEFPEIVSEFQRGNKDKIYDALKEKIRVFSRSELFLLRIIDTGNVSVKKELCMGDSRCGEVSSPEMLLSIVKDVEERDGYFFLRVKGGAGKYRAYLVFPKNAQRIENVEILKAFLSQALVFCELEEACAICSAKNKPSTSHEEYRY